MVRIYKCTQIMLHQLNWIGLLSFLTIWIRKTPITILAKRPHVVQ